MCGWEHFHHQADIGVRGRGETLEEAFAQAATALTAVITDPTKVNPRKTIRVECEAPDRELLLADWLNEGEAYEKIPSFIPYFALPLGMALLLFRFLQVAWRLATGRQDLIIASHEAEGLVEEAAAKAPARDRED